MRRAFTARFCPLAALRGRTARGPPCEAKLYDVDARSFDHSPTRRTRRQFATTTLRLGAQAPLRPLRTGATGTQSPRDLPACLADGTTARGRSAPAGRPGENRHARGSARPCGTRRRGCARVVVHAQPRRLGRGAARRGRARAGERAPRGRRGAQGGGGRRQGAHARRPQRGRGAAQGPQPRGRALGGAARRACGPARPARRRRRGARESPRRARRGAERARGAHGADRGGSSSASSSASRP